MNKIGHVCLLTGRPGAGKTTISRLVRKRCEANNVQVTLLDGDDVRQDLCADLGFSKEDREENMRRVAAVARMLFEQGHTVMVALIAPHKSTRDIMRNALPVGALTVVHVHALPETCIARDPKGMYKEAKRGDREDFTGVSASYDLPEKPHIKLDTENMTAEECAKVLFDNLSNRAVPRRIAS